MGGSSGTNTVEKQAQPSAEERALLQLQVNQETALAPSKLQAAKSGMGIINQLLAGQTNLPGFMGSMAEGISPSAVNDLTQQSLNSLYPQFQQGGLMDSGVAMAIAGRTAGDIQRQVYEYNLQNKYNLLNLALTGQAGQLQSSQNSSLMNSLAGLRGQTSSTPYNNTARAAGGAAGGALSGGYTGGQITGGNPWGIGIGAVVGGIGGYLSGR